MRRRTDLATGPCGSCRAKLTRKNVVNDWMRDARLIVVDAGPTEGLFWEP